MNCCAENNFENYKSYDVPIFAGTFRFLVGLILMFAGLYVAMLTDLHGHGLGFLLVFSAPFLIFKDGK